MRIIIILCISSLYSYAQDAGNINDLLKKLSVVKTDTARAEIYAGLCFDYTTLNPDSALWYGNKAMDLSTNMHYKKGIADAYNSLGWLYYRKSDNIKAKNYFETALTLFKEVGTKELIARPLCNIGELYVDEGNYAIALSNYTKALEYMEGSSDKNREAEIYYSIGRLYNLEKNPVKARSYFQQALAMHKKTEEELFAAQALSSIANTYQFEEKFDTALLYYKQVLPVFIKHRDLYRTGNVYENIAIAYTNKKQYAIAIFNMQKAKKFFQKINSKTDVAYADLGLGEEYCKSGNMQSGIQAYNEALATAKETNDKDLEYDIKQSMSENFQLTGDYKNAYLFLDSAVKIKDSLFTKEKENALLKLQTQFETERKEKENQLLKTQNLAAVLQLERNKDLLIASAICIVLLATLLYALYKNRQTKIKNINLLKELNTKLEQQKEEITRINTILELKALRAQMNPHFIFNCMSSIQECMLTGRLDDANTYLTKLSRLLRMVLNYSDEESITLDKELQMLELYLQLERIRLKNNLEYIVELDDNIIEEELSVPALILQPFAENAIWHGLVNKQGERKLIIKGEIKNQMLHFTITDNGIGRKLAKELKPETIRHASKGIALIKKRLDIIKNRTNNYETGFIIHDLYNNNHSSAGTSVEINLPLNEV